MNNDKTPNNRATPRTEATFNALVDAMIGYDKKQLYFSDLANACYAAKCDFQDVERELTEAKAEVDFLTRDNGNLLAARNSFEQFHQETCEESAKHWIMAKNLNKEVAQLRARVAEQTEEIEVLRNWGNKDCTAMADAELERRWVARRKGQP